MSSELFSCSVMWTSSSGSERTMSKRRFASIVTPPGVVTRAAQELRIVTSRSVAAICSRPSAALEQNVRQNRNRRAFFDDSLAKLQLFLKIRFCDGQLHVSSFRTRVFLFSSGSSRCVRKISGSRCKGFESIAVPAMSNLRVSLRKSDGEFGRFPQSGASVRDRGRFSSAAFRGDVSAGGCGIHRNCFVSIFERARELLIVLHHSRRSSRPSTSPSSDACC